MKSLPGVPDDVARMLAVVREPRRLAILLSLEDQPRTAMEVSRALDLPYSTVDWAMKKLSAEGLIVRVALADDDGPPSRGRELGKLYRTRHTGWTTIVGAFVAIAGTAADSVDADVEP
jgi:DNA-binding transcriptional ArsR family regulator